MIPTSGSDSKELPFQEDPHGSSLKEFPVLQGEELTLTNPAGIGLTHRHRRKMGEGIGGRNQMPRQPLLPFQIREGKGGGNRKATNPRPPQRLQMGAYPKCTAQIPPKGADIGPR